MKKFLFFIFIALMIQCSPDKEINIHLEDIQGIWCNDLNFCHCFIDNQGLLNSYEFHPYQISADSIFYYKKGSTERFTQIAYELFGDQLLMGMHINRKPRILNQPSKKNSVLIDSLHFSILSEMHDFNATITADSSIFFEVKNAPKKEAGFYSGKLKREHMKMMEYLIQAVDLNVSIELDSTIISDIDEWAIILKTQSNESYQLYHNYLGNGKEHNYLGFFLSKILFLTTEEKIKQDKFSNPAESFRKKEFDRNLKMTQ